MKKIIIVLALALVTAFTAKAQLYFGGALTFSANVDNAATVTFFGIAPEVGYNLNDNMAVGIAFGIAPSSQKVNGTVVQKVTVFTFDPYFRYYFLDWGPVRLFADANFNFTSATTEVPGVGKQSQNTWGIGVNPGIAIPVGDSFSVVAHVGRLGYYAEAFHIGINEGSSLGVYYAF